MTRLLLAPALLLAAVLGAVACGGGKADLETLATRAADATPAPSLAIRARAVKFDKDTLVAPAGREIVVALDNQDAGVSHNFAVYSAKDAKQNLFRGELFEGKETREFRFQSPEAGVYYFRCDAHPDMDGVFISR